MKPQRLLIGVFIVVAGLLIVWLTRPALPPRVEKAGPVSAQSEPAPPVDAMPATPPAISAPLPPDAATASVPKPLNPPPLPPAPAVPQDPVAPAAQAPPTRERLRADLDEVQFALRDFRTGLGGNPVGSNAEITKALLGDNRKQIKIPVPSGSQLNASSELCDRFGTPYFFHQISGTQMEIRSAGADRKMWTADDVEK